MEHCAQLKWNLRQAELIFSTQEMNQNASANALGLHRGKERQLELISPSSLNSAKMKLFSCLRLEDSNLTPWCEKCHPLQLTLCSLRCPMQPAFLQMHKVSVEAVSGYPKSQHWALPEKCALHASADILQTCSTWAQRCVPNHQRVSPFNHQNFEQ